MKAKVLALAIVLFTSVSLFSKSNDKVIYSNISNESKEYTIMNSDNAPLSKIVHLLDDSGNRTQKAVYKWDNNAGWMAIEKTEYNYNTDGQVAYIVYTEWDSKTSTWSSESQLLLHTYDSHGHFLATEQTKINNYKIKLLTSN